MSTNSRRDLVAQNDSRDNDFLLRRGAARLRTGFLGVCKLLSPCWKKDGEFSDLDSCQMLTVPTKIEENLLDFVVNQCALSMDKGHSAYPPTGSRSAEWRSPPADPAMASVVRRMTTRERESEAGRAAWKKEIGNFLQSNSWGMNVVAIEDLSDKAIIVPTLDLSTIKNAEMSPSLQKHKARLAAKGNCLRTARGQAVVEDTAVWAPVATLDGARITIANAVLRGYPMQCIDLIGAYLQVALGCAVTAVQGRAKRYYVDLPEFVVRMLDSKVQKKCADIRAAGKRPVFPLLKAMYGLERSGLDCIAVVAGVLDSAGWWKTPLHPAVLYRPDPDLHIQAVAEKGHEPLEGPNPSGAMGMLTTYVDDILAGAPKVQFSNLWAAIRERFGTTPAEEPRRYLGAQLFRGLWAKSAGGRGTAKLFISMLEYSEKAIGDYKSESGRQVYAQSCAMTQTVMEDLLFLKAAQEHKKTLEKSLAAGKGAGRPPPDMPYLAHERSERPLVEKREGLKAPSAKKKSHSSRETRLERK